MKKTLYRPSLLATVLIATLALSGCFKSSDHEDLPATGVAFVHASPKNDVLEFVDYDTYGSVRARLSYNTSAAYPTKDNATTPYLAFYPGARTFGLAKAGTSFFYNIKQFALRPNKVYSVFAVDSADKAELLLVQDSLKIIDSTKTAIKFINLSPDAGKIDFYIGNTRVPFAQDVAFKDFTAYKLVEPTTNATFSIQTKTGTGVTSNRSNIELKKGGTYTVWARGLVNSTTKADTLAISILKTR